MIGRFGDLAISRLFTNTFSCVSVRFSPRLELDVAVVSGSGPCHDPHRLACWVILRPHHRSRSLLHPGSRVHVLLVTARRSAASSVVVDLGFCGVSR